MDYSTLPIYSTKNQNFDYVFPFSMRFIMKNYKWVAKTGYALEEIKKNRIRDKKVGKAMTRLLKKNLG